jgi:hypothetical protein
MQNTNARRKTPAEIYFIHLGNEEIYCIFTDMLRSQSLFYNTQNAVYFIMLSLSVSSIFIFLHGLGRLTCSGIDALPSFPGASTISSPSRFVVEGVFQMSGVVHSFKVIDQY